MIFQRIIYSALLVGVLSGLVLGLLHHWGTTPLILEAERFESNAGHHDTTLADHEHEKPASWVPEDGLERLFWTGISDILMAIGLALILLSLMALSSGPGRELPDWRKGLIWGAAAWLVLFAIPSLGLRPQIPGMDAAPLQQRQTWWLITVLCGIAALAGVAFIHSRVRWLAPLLLLPPFLIGAPHPTKGPFAGQPLDTAARLDDIADYFYLASAIDNAIFWLLTGLLCAIALRRWVLRDRPVAGEPA